MRSKKSIHTQDHYGIRQEARVFPMMVVLSFSYVCNAHCPSCPYNNSTIRQSYSDALYMPEKIFKAIADECSSHKSLLRITGGGEPMLHPQAMELLTYAKLKGCKIGLITNGSKFSRSQLEALIKLEIDVIEFSVDAADEKAYSHVRGLDWQRLNRNVEMARKIRDSTGSSTRLVASVINQVGIDIEFVRRYWSPLVDNVQVRKFLTWGYNEDLSADKTPYLAPESRLPCPWLFERLNIDSRGDVTLCGEDIAFKEKFANVLDRSIADIWLGPEMEKIRKHHLNYQGDEVPICSTCPDWKYRSWKYNYWKVLQDAQQREEN